MIKDFLIVCLFLFPSVSFAAETYMVMQWNHSTRIVLQDKSCLVQGLTGARAVVQRTDGAYIKGCWNYIDGGKHIKIDWDNPAKPGDFAVLEVVRFEVVTE